MTQKRPLRGVSLRDGFVLRVREGVTSHARVLCAKWPEHLQFWERIEELNNFHANSIRARRAGRAGRARIELPSRREIVKVENKAAATDTLRRQNKRNIASGSNDFCLLGCIWRPGAGCRADCNHA